MKQYAPVVIPTLNRYNHFVACIESLEKCIGAQHTDVYVGLDYPTTEKYVEGWRMIDEYLKQKELCNGFKNLVVFRRDKNCGVGNPQSNYVLLYKYVLNEYDCYIATEDDNVFSVNFLEYINANLIKYWDEHSVYAICGYSFPINITHSNASVYRTFMYSPWGCAFWRHKFWRESAEEIDSYLSDYKKASSLYKTSPYLFDTIVSMRYNNVCYNDAVIRARLIIENRSCISPISSKVRNCGYDDSGINCSNDGGIHMAQLIDCSDSYVDNGELCINDLKDIYNKFFTVSFYSKIKSILKYLIYFLCR